MQFYNEQATRSPKKETSKVVSSEILYEISPTGIMGFPDSAPARKAVVKRRGLPTLQSLHFSAERTAEESMKQRFSTMKEYWDTAEQELTSGHREFVIPRCENPFQGFAVTQGHVRHLVAKWSLLFEPFLPNMVAPAVPMPGDAVLEMATFFDKFAENQCQASEPFVVYKSLSDTIRDRVAALEALYVFQQPVKAPVVYRHVSPKLQPLVTWWNITMEAAKTAPLAPMQCAKKHKNPRVVVMANLMQKKLERMNIKTATEASPAPPHPAVVLQMVSLLEAVNYHTKTGVHDGNPRAAGHLHQIKSLPLVC